MEMKKSDLSSEVAITLHRLHLQHIIHQQMRMYHLHVSWIAGIPLVFNF